MTIWQRLRSRNTSRPVHYYRCRRCGSVAEPVMIWEGSMLLAWILFLLFLLPGLIYALWRYHRRFPVCPVCGSSNVKPTTQSPAAGTPRK